MKEEKKEGEKKDESKTINLLSLHRMVTMHAARNTRILAIESWKQEILKYKEGTSEHASCVTSIERFSKELKDITGFLDKYDKADQLVK